MQLLQLAGNEKIDLQKRICLMTIPERAEDLDVLVSVKSICYGLKVDEASGLIVAKCGGVDFSPLVTVNLYSETISSGKLTFPFDVRERYLIGNNYRSIDVLYLLMQRKNRLEKHLAFEKCDPCVSRTQLFVEINEGSIDLFNIGNYCVNVVYRASETAKPKKFLLN